MSRHSHAGTGHPDDGTNGLAESNTTPQRSGDWKQRWGEIGLIFGFWAAVFALLASQHAWMHDHSLWAKGGRWVLPPAAKYFLWALLSVAVFWLVRSFPVQRRNWMTRLPLFAGVGVGVAFLSATSTKIAHKYLGVCDCSCCNKALVALLSDQLQAGFPVDDFFVYLGVLGSGLALSYYRKYQVRQQQATQLQKQLAEARLESLRKQIHPHFLFNTLHAVSAFVDRDPPAARRMVSRLSDLLRRVLDEMDRPEVPLREELAFTDDYLAIMQTRLNGRLSVEKDIEPTVEEALVPNLVLQPLVENAIKHGVTETSGPGCIHLEAWREEERLYVRVSDDGPGLPEHAESSDEGIGLKNTRRRLHELYGDAARLSLRNAEDTGGLVVTLALPYHTMNDLHLGAAP